VEKREPVQVKVNKRQGYIQSITISDDQQTATVLIRYISSGNVHSSCVWSDKTVTMSMKELEHAKLMIGDKIELTSFICEYHRVERIETYNHQHDTTMTMDNEDTRITEIT